MKDIREILSVTDHTCLSVTATQEDIDLLCRQAAKYRTASVCVPPSYVSYAAECLVRTGQRLPVCTVIGFPNGYSLPDVKAFEAEKAIENGADELDMVINIGEVKNGRFDRVLSEINLIKSVCNGRILKVIIETCLLTEEEKLRLCGVVSFSAADYIKTSTGFAGGGAAVSDVLLLKANLKNGTKLKAAGGISTFEFASELLEAGADRLGSSRLAALAEKADPAYGGF